MMASQLPAAQLNSEAGHQNENGRESTSSVAEDVIQESNHLSLPETWDCPVMSAEYATEITVPFACVLENGSQLNEVLDTHGVAIVTGILNCEELKELENLFDDDLRDLVDNDAVESAHVNAIAEAAARVQAEGARGWPSGTSLGEKNLFALKHALPHGRFAWAARTHPNVRATFATLYTEELGADKGGEGGEGMVVSTDVVFFTPAGVGDTGSSGEGAGSSGEVKLWPH
ncbi:unnamed protein product, partial [Heterosigma akashiwo]